MSAKGSAVVRMRFHRTAPSSRQPRKLCRCAQSAFEAAQEAARAVADAADAAARADLYQLAVRRRMAAGRMLWEGGSEGAGRHCGRRSAGRCPDTWHISCKMHGRDEHATLHLCIRMVCGSC